MTSVLYSIVIPTYNSEPGLKELVERIDAVFKATNWIYEIIFIDDHSTDKSLDVIKKLAIENKKIKYIAFRKNYGQHCALLAGFRYVSGNYVITMDDDLQNPPEEIPKLINHIQKTDLDVVFAQFEKKKHAQHRIWGSKIIKWLNERIFHKPKELILSNFRIIKKEIVDEVVKHFSPFVYIPGLLFTITHNCGNVLTRHEERKYGKSGYIGFTKIFKLVQALVFVFSDFSLRIVIRVGLFFSLVGLILSGFVLLKNLLLGVSVKGWTSLIFIVSFFSSINLLVSGVLGEYLLIVLKNAIGEKQYFIKEKNI
jgi:polyisoprenyl-phosphate glycosyltransferase